MRIAQRHNLKKTCEPQLFISNLLTGQDFKSHIDFQLFEVHCNVFFPSRIPCENFQAVPGTVRVLVPVPYGTYLYRSG